MLHKTHRLTRSDFLQAKKHGVNHTTPFYSFLSLSTSLPFSRFAIVTSSKLHKSAVIRNRLRRHVYQAVADIPGSHDIIIFPKKSLLELFESDPAKAKGVLTKAVMSLS